MKKIRVILNNQRGSVLSVSLIVIALLSFSLSVITGDTLNLAGQTTEVQNNIQDTSYGKKVLDIALAEMKEFVLASTQTNPITDYLESSYTEYDPVSDSDVIYDSRADKIFLDYGVSSEDLTVYPSGEILPESGSPFIIKLSMILQEGITISRTTYYSFSSESSSNLSGSAAIAEILDDFNQYNPDGTYDPYEINFYFSLVTNGDLIMNGGYYDFPAIYAKNIYMSNESPFLWNGDPSQQYLTADNEGSDPLYKYDNLTRIFYDTDYQFCQSGSCITLGDTSNPTIIHKSAYSDVVGSSYDKKGDPQDYKLDEFFTNFNYDTEFLNFLVNEAPSGSDTLSGTVTMNNFEDVIMNNSSSSGGDKFIDITNNVGSYTDKNKTRDFSVVYDGRDSNGDYTNDLVLDERLAVSDDCSIIVIGDLTLDSISSSGNEMVFQSIEGTLIVTGDLTLTGSTMILRNTVIVLGELTFDFDPGQGLDNIRNSTDFQDNNNKFNGLTILAKDNVYFNSFFETHNADATGEINFFGFIYTEESIFIDAVNSHIYLQGSMYARARGVSGNYLPYEDENGDPILGVIINSYNGYIDDTSSIPSGDINNHSFRMTNFDYQSIQVKFANLPLFQVKVRSDEYFVDDGYETE